MIRKSPSVMESQEESLDIIELKRLVLGLNVSHPIIPSVWCETIMSRSR